MTDVAPGMVAAAARRAAHLPQVSTGVCDQVKVDAEDGSFDAVLCRLGLMFADPPVAVAEAVRVLRPGGRYAALCWATRADNPWLGLIMDAIGEELGEPFPPPDARGPFTLADPVELARALEAGGLSGVAVTQIDAPLRMPSLHDWWEIVPEIAAPVAQALAGVSDQTREAIGARALAHGERVARRVAGGIELGGAVLLASGAA
jgi:SAM-dependent methyltransferase